MIPNEEKEGRWHYLAIKKLSASLHKLTSKNKCDFYCSNCLHSFRTENKLKYYEKGCKSKDFCGIVVHQKRIKYQKSNKMLYIIYADTESLIKKQMDV